MADIGKLLIFEWTPVRSDGEEGEVVSIPTRAPVMHGAPAVSSVTVAVENTEEPLALRTGSGTYFGGIEVGDGGHFKGIVFDWCCCRVRADSSGSVCSQITQEHNKRC